MFKNLKELIFAKNNLKEKEERIEDRLSKSLDKNVLLLQQIFKNEETIVFREVMNDNLYPSRFVLLFSKGMVNREVQNEHILDPLIKASREIHLTHKDFMDELIQKVLQSGDIEKTAIINDLVNGVLYGDTILLADHADEALIINTKGWQMRGIEEPESESVVQGPREGFNESIIINISLLKRRVKSPDLKFRFTEIGRRTKTKVCISYIEGLANEKIIEELNKRIKAIDIDGILDAGYIEELIKDAPLSPWRTIGSTERPDVVAGKLLEGRVAVFCDGSPFVLTLPFIMQEYFQANEDYYTNYYFASYNRCLRFFAFFLSVSIPAIYVALVTYHQEMIPTPLIISFAAARKGVPFPTIFQAFIMLIAFEILREAGVRLPKPIGQAISIVGALVLGEAAVRANLVGAPMVIVTALTAISSFLIPKMMAELVLTRFLLLILSGMLGLYGYMFGVMGLYIHLMAIRSFGIPYMMNAMPLNKQDIKDMTIRAPWWYMYYRPKLIGDRNTTRKGDTGMQGRR